MKYLIAQIGNLVRSFIHRSDSENAPTPNTTQDPTEFLLADNKKQSIVGSGVAISGNLNCQDHLIIDGQFKGSIQASENTVVIGCNGLVDGDIKANNLCVKGKVIGDISLTETIVITETGTIVGSLRAAKISLEQGAKYKGIIQIDPIEELESASDAVPDESTPQRSVPESSALEPS